MKKQQTLGWTNCCCLSHTHPPMTLPNRRISLRYPCLLSMTQGRIPWFTTLSEYTLHRANRILCKCSNCFGFRVGWVLSHSNQRKWLDSIVEVEDLTLSWWMWMRDHIALMALMVTMRGQQEQDEADAVYARAETERSGILSDFTPATVWQ